MFELIRFALEKTIEGIVWALNQHKVGKDRQIGLELLDLFECMQNVYVVGNRLVDALEDLVSRDASAESNDLNRGSVPLLLQEQFRNIDRLVAAIESSRRALSAVNGSMFVELTPLLDRKSGLLTKLLQESKMSNLSSTAVFYLEYKHIESLAGKTINDEFRRELSNQVNALRAVEIRDVTILTTESRLRLRNLIRGRRIREELDQIKALSGRFYERLAAAYDLKAITRGGL